jgi:hypothetical protein
MVVSVLLLTGCASSPVTTTSLTATTTEVKEVLVTRIIPISEVSRLYIDQTVIVDGVTTTKTTRGSDGVFPPEINPLKVNYGDELSTWTASTPALAIKNGDPLSIGIFNRTGEEVTYNISYVADAVGLKDDDGNEYETISTPIFWTEFSDKTVTVPPETVAYVAVRISIPKKAQGFTLPDRWAFQILVSPSQGGNIQRAYRQNWLISMR